MAREPKKYPMFGNLRAQDLRALGIGLELSVVIGVFTYGGYWLDEKWGTSPLLLLIGVAIGTLGGGWHAIKMANGGKVPDFGFKKPEPKPDKQASEDKASEEGDEPAA